MQANLSKIKNLGLQRENRPVNTIRTFNINARGFKTNDLNIRSFHSTRKILKEETSLNFHPRSRDIRISTEYLPGHKVLKEAFDRGLETNQLKSAKEAPTFSQIKKSFIDFEGLEDGDELAIENINSVSTAPSSQSLEKFDDETENLSEQEKILYERQLNFEQEAVSEAAAKYVSLVEELTKMGKAASLSANEKMIVKWFQPIMESIKAEQTRSKTPNTPEAKRAAVEGTINCLPAEKMAVIALHTVLGMTQQNPSALSITKICVEIGDACLAEVSMEIVKDSKNQRLLHHVTRNTSSVHKINLLTKSFTSLQWDSKMKALLGSKLLEKVITHTFINDKPAFVKDLLSNNGRQTGIIKPSDELIEVVNAHHDMVTEFGPAKHFPMVVKPNPWKGCKTGGYLRVTHPIIRLRGYRKQLDEIEMKEAAQPNFLAPLYDAINCLASTPWVINKEMSDIIQEAWERGMTIGDIPSKQDHEIPEEPPKDADPAVLQAFRRKIHKVKLLNGDLGSLRASLQYQLNVARKFASDVIYFPHNMDFRGRTYPIPPHLNHLGNDMCRSLLTFSEKKKIGVEGLRWMKIHMANLYGVDKVPFDERVQFVEDNIEKVFESADNPLDGSQWWLTADKPWQFLANCVELTRAVRSGNPSEWETGLPVHQDGTCNGLQHYAALGGDVLGAKQVNLTPSDRPQDVYSGVAEIVKRRVAEDAEAGDPMAQILKDHISRKIVKQTVMTSVYGVTFLGASRQISNQLSDLHLFTSDHDEMKASSYLAKHTFSSLGEIFLGAQTLMDWLAVCAKKIASEGGKDVSWTTPLGLKVIQPYKLDRGSETHVKTILQTITLKPAAGLRVSVAKQKSAFPPNYIHSLDSTHMLLTAKRMNEMGLTFASVHDSYWTHASSVPQMNVILREEFVNLHSKPLLENLLDEFKTNHPNITFQDLPPRGELDINRVRDSQYFFN